MKKLAFCVVGAAMVVTALAAPADEDDQAEVHVVGLQVAKPLSGDKGKQSLTGRRTGTALTLRVTRPGKHLLGVDEKRCILETFTDDLGTDLVGESGRMLRTWLDGRVWASPDGRDCLFEIVSLKTPARGARRLKLKTRMVLKCGRDGVTAEQTDFRLAKDSRLKVGPAPMKVTGVQRGEKTTIFTMSTKGSTERIAAIRFYGADGNQIDTQLIEKAVVGFMGNTFYDWTYCLKTDKPMVIESVTARVQYFNKVERITVPVEISAGVGL